MDMRTGKIYESLEEAKLDGAKEEDLLKVNKSLKDELDKLPIAYPKNPFGSIRNRIPEKV